MGPSDPDRPEGYNQYAPVTEKDSAPGAPAESHCLCRASEKGPCNGACDCSKLGAPVRNLLRVRRRRERMRQPVQGPRARPFGAAPDPASPPLRAHPRFTHWLLRADPSTRHAVDVDSLFDKVLGGGEGGELRDAAEACYQLEDWLKEQDQQGAGAGDDTEKRAALRAQLVRYAFAERACGWFFSFRRRRGGSWEDDAGTPPAYAFPIPASLTSVPLFRGRMLTLDNPVHVALPDV